jgi:hypothetical protein|uniref:Uncharacterized protein n=1 Tax=Bacteriophage sp. TaxID=38018 RepID=A0A8D9PEH5_9VIRU|nr:MAG TPA: hypothetical protein [Bacteriophage sp.]
MIVHVTNIEWDTDENDIPSESLPSEVDLEYDDLCTSFLRDMEAFICESLEERYGYCIKNFAIDT